MTKDRFNQLFANLPLPGRANPIYVDQQYGAMSWNLCKLEIDAGTLVGVRALQFIDSLHSQS